MEPGWFILALLVMLVGLAGVVIPFLPGTPLILVGAFLYAFATGFDGGIGWGHLAVIGIIGGATVLFETLAQAVGTRVAGGSRAGVVGAVVGLVVGLLVGGPVGLVVGPFVGAVALELATGRTGRQAMRSGMGAALGFLAGAVVEFAVAIGLIGFFVASVLAAG